MQNGSRIEASRAVSTLLPESGELPEQQTANRDVRLSSKGFGRGCHVRLEKVCLASALYAHANSASTTCNKSHTKSAMAECWDTCCAEPTFVLFGPEQIPSPRECSRCILWDPCSSHLPCTEPSKPASFALIGASRPLTSRPSASTTARFVVVT